MRRTRFRLDLRSLGDNASDTKNVTLPESTLHKRHHSIANHKCREELREGRRVLRMNPGSFARSVLHSINVLTLLLCFISSQTPDGG